MISPGGNAQSCPRRDLEVLDRWLRFASGPLVHGEPDCRLAELLIVRTAWNCRCAYEWQYHTSLGRGLVITEREFEAPPSASPGLTLAPRSAICPGLPSVTSRPCSSTTFSPTPDTDRGRRRQTVPAAARRRNEVRYGLAGPTRLQSPAPHGLTMCIV